MGKTTTPPRPAAQDAIRKLQPNSAAGAVIPLQSYLDKYVAQFSDKLVPSTPPTLPNDVDPNAYKRVAFSIQPLSGNAVSPYYAGVSDDDTDFSASLVKVAALFAAGQLLADAKASVVGEASATSFFTHFNTGLKAEISANADPRIIAACASFPSTSPVGLLPQTSKILSATGFGTASGPTVAFTSTFTNNQSLMIVESSDPAAGTCIDRLGYGYISAALIEENFFNPSTSNGIWLAGDYVQSQFVKRIPCVNDHPDTELATTRQMCRLFAMIRLKQLPEHDLDTNKLMQNLLNEPKAGPNATGPWLGRNPGTQPRFTIVQDKIGFAGLGTVQRPNVYSEGLIIRWGNDPDPQIVDPQIVAFNQKVDPTNANPAIRLSGEIAVCWQNLLAELIDGGTAADPMFSPVVDVINNTVSDFLDRAAV
jgi:hypothetical protein